MDAQGSVTYGGQSRITALRRAPPRAAPLRRPPPPRALPGDLDLPVSGDGAGRRNPAVSSPKGLPVSAASGDGTRGPRGRRAFIKAARVADRRSPSAFSICRMSAAPRRLVASRVFVCLRRLSCMVPSLHVLARIHRRTALGTVLEEAIGCCCPGKMSGLSVQRKCQ